MIDESKYKIRSLQRLIEIMKGVIKEGSMYDWLNTPNECLGGKKPFELCFTDEGYDQVEDLLNRIKYGIPE